MSRSAQIVVNTAALTMNVFSVWVALETDMYSKAVLPVALGLLAAVLLRKSIMREG